MSSRLAPSFQKPGPLADFEKIKGERYLKEILISNSFSFEDKDPSTGNGTTVA